MRQLLFLPFLFISFVGLAQAGRKADKDTKIWRYELESAGEGNEGTYLVKVWSYSKKPNVAIEQAKKNAIHGVIFQGVPASGRFSSQPPIARTAGLENEKADFFNAFFDDGGAYMKYVAVSGDGSVDGDDYLKVGKEYKVGVVVSVRKDLLKKDLQAQGIIQGLSSGFD